MKTNQKIAIVTHDMFYGCPHALRDYVLSKKVKKVTFISLPLVEQRKSSICVYGEGKLILQRQIDYKVRGVLSYIIDFFLVIYWVIGQREKYNLFIAVDPLNAFSGLVLKKLGLIERIIFYSMDFVPIHFENRLLNFIYHKIESLCVKNSDEVWNVSPKIAEGREEFLSISKKKYPQKVVNSGIWINKVKKFPFEKVKRHQLLFLGHLLKKQGIQLVLEAAPFVIKKIPDFKFVILGGGEYEENLRKQVEKLNIKKYVEFKGWIEDREVIDTTLGESAIAIVTYVPEKEKLRNFSYYGDPIKIKEYLASGLPIILTDVSHNAKEIHEERCGILVNYDKKDIENAIISLLNNEEKLKEYRKNAFEYAKGFDWNVIFSRAFN